MKKSKGKLICFEGLDGVGKTTTSEGVAKALLACGHSVLFVNKKTTEFSQSYLERHMSGLKEILWGFPSDAPIHMLGDRHWLYLMASWFSVLDRCVVEPALLSGKTVIVDNWCYKFLARFKLKTTIPFSEVESCFAALNKPDLIVFLDADAAVAAARKAQFSVSEAGNADGLKGLTKENFIEYQTRVRQAMDEVLGGSRKVNICTNILSKSQVVAAAVDQILAAGTLPILERKPQELAA